MTDPVVDRLLAAINARNPDAIADCFTEDYVCEWPAHPNLTFTGREAVRRNQVMRFAAWPTVQAEIVHSVSVGDEVWQDWRFFGEADEERQQRGVVALMIDRDQGLIRGSRFYVETVADLEPS